ncbi:hypothetical protein [Streptomyces sp. NPDC058424]|uniref:hypothetical protein n=1 Tax=Streptomyces sp. NPDC058424 TaxID=3346491 RepID=UPI003665E52D
MAASIPIALATTPASASASCGTGVADKDGSSWNKAANEANQRLLSDYGSSVYCGF